VVTLNDLEATVVIGTLVSRRSGSGIDKHR
jgi:hypothetical protein